jgi:hypothetical protein
MTNPTPVREPGQWPALGRIGFRVLFAYLILFTVPGPFGYLPFGIARTLSSWYFEGTLALSRWTQIHVFGIASPAPFAFTGSSDTIYRYATHFNYVVIAIVAGVVWTLVDRRRSSYARLDNLLRAWVRLALATIILGYGFAKVLPTQFGTPLLAAYAQPLGEFSPMGLLWVFMGSSTAYTAFSGAVEVVGALCLLFRRTATLGALILFGALLNVALLNFTYDVPVKLFTLNLLLLIVYIAAPDMRRLADVLFFNRPTAPRPARPLFVSRWANYGALGAGALFAGFIVWSNVSDGLQMLRDSRAAKVASPLYGIYDVEQYRSDVAAAPPAGAQPLKWRQVIFDARNRVTIRSSDVVTVYRSKVDATQHALTLTDRAAPTQILALTFEEQGAGQLVLRGRVDGDAIVATLRRIDESKYLLLSRGFSWIQERPFNR